MSDMREKNKISLCSSFDLVSYDEEEENCKKQIKNLRATIRFVRNENIKRNNDCKTLAQKLLQVKPELRDWLEVNFKEYL